MSLLFRIRWFKGISDRCLKLFVRDVGEVDLVVDQVPDKLDMGGIFGLLLKARFDPELVFQRFLILGCCVGRHDDRLGRREP